jgi:CxxC motif-containing protein
MAEKHELTCIGCPMGCLIEVLTENGVVTKITGFQCAKGEKYAAGEIVDPRRTVTSILPVDGGVLGMVPVKTAGEVPKQKIPEIMRILKTLRVSAPVAAGQVVLPDLCGTGVCLIATRSIPAR